MALEATTLHVTTNVSGSYWGRSFNQNGLYILLETKEYEGASAALTGPEILDTVLTSYTNFTTHDLSTVAQILTSIENKQNIQTFVLGIQKESDLYLGSVGDGEVLMMRGDKVGTILRKNEVSHGQIQPNDTLIFYPSSFRTLYQDDIIPTLVSPTNATALVDRVKTDLVNFPDIKGMTLLIAQLSNAQLVRTSVSLETFKEKISNWKQSGVEKIKHIFKKENATQTQMYLPDAKDVRSKRILLGISSLLVL
jgi:hypothetical protein